MLAAYLDALSHFSRNVRLCLIATALLGFNMFGGIFTVLFNLYLLRLGYGPEFVGLANATGAMVFALSSVPAIILGGRLGSRRTMIAGLMLCVVGFGSVPGAAFASQAFHGSLLVAAYSLGLLGISLHIVNVSPFLMSATAPDERNHAFSLNAALLPLSGFAGSLVAGYPPGPFLTALEPVDGRSGSVPLHALSVCGAVGTRDFRGDGDEGGETDVSRETDGEETGLPHGPHPAAVGCLAIAGRR